jgi:hypothetical protein
MLILSISQQNIYIPIGLFISINRCFLFWIRNGKATTFSFITALEFISKLNGHWLSKFTYLAIDNLNANDWLVWENIILTRSKTTNPKPQRLSDSETVVLHFHSCSKHQRYYLFNFCLPFLS